MYIGPAGGLVDRRGSMGELTSVCLFVSTLEGREKLAESTSVVARHWRCLTNLSKCHPKSCLEFGIRRGTSIKQASCDSHTSRKASETRDLCVVETDR